MPKSDHFVSVALKALCSWNYVPLASLLMAAVVAPASWPAGENPRFALPNPPTAAEQNQHRYWSGCPMCPRREVAGTMGDGNCAAAAPQPESLDDDFRVRAWTGE